MSKRARLTIVGGIAALTLVAACGDSAPDPVDAAELPTPAGDMYTVREETVDAVLEAAGIAEPFQRATLSTKLMGSVTAVLAREGDVVRSGQVIARIDARDIAARRGQVSAGIAEAEAVHQDALTQANRFRSLYADSAATRAQLDAVETGLARAEAGVRAARAGAGELDAIGSYAQIRAPFAGMVTQRFVDPGAFVAPGAPVAAVEDASRLRVSVTVAPAAAAGLERGGRVAATIEGRPADAVIEGVVPAPGGALYTVNAIVDNPDRIHPSGGTATLRLPIGTRTSVMIPAAALVREGDLVGVRVVTAAGPELRWVRTGVERDDAIEVLSGLRSGDRIVLPSPAAVAAPEGGR
jgi:RND family efflux transporter MFP subunit